MQPFRKKKKIHSTRGAPLCQTKKHQNNVPPQKELPRFVFRRFGGRPFAKPKNTKTTCLLRQNYRDFFFGASGGGPLPNQKTPKQRASLDRITDFFWLRCGFKNQTGVIPIQNAIEKKKKTLQNWFKNNSKWFQKGTNWCRNASRPLPYRKR
jgi:hypothetical protein